MYGFDFSCYIQNNFNNSRFKKCLHGKSIDIKTTEQILFCLCLILSFSNIQLKLKRFTTYYIHELSLFKKTLNNNKSQYIL